MPYKIEGVTRETGQPVPAFVVDAESEDQALKMASSKGVLVQRVAHVRRQSHGTPNVRPSDAERDKQEQMHRTPYRALKFYAWLSQVGGMVAIGLGVIIVVAAVAGVGGQREGEFVGGMLLAVIGLGAVAWAQLIILFINLELNVVRIRMLLDKNKSD